MDTKVAAERETGPGTDDRSPTDCATPVRYNRNMTCDSQEPVVHDFNHWIHRDTAEDLSVDFRQPSTGSNVVVAQSSEWCLERLLNAQGDSRDELEDEIGVQYWAHARDEVTNEELGAARASGSSLESAVNLRLSNTNRRISNMTSINIEHLDDHGASAENDSHGVINDGEASGDEGNSSDATDEDAGALDDEEDSGEGVDSEDESIDFADAGDRFADALAEDWSIRHRVSDGNELEDDFAEGIEPSWRIMDGNEFEDDFAEGIEPRWRIMDGNEFDDDFAEGDDPLWRVKDGNELEDDFAEGQWEPSWKIVTSEIKPIEQPIHSRHNPLPRNMQQESSVRVCSSQKQLEYRKLRWRIEKVDQDIMAKKIRNPRLRGALKEHGTLSPSLFTKQPADARLNVEFPHACRTAQATNDCAALLGHKLLGIALGNRNNAPFMPQMSGHRGHHWDSYALRHPNHLHFSLAL